VFARKPCRATSTSAIADSVRAGDDYNVGRVRLIKWVSLGLGALVALVVLGVLVIVWLVDPNRFKPNIEAAVRDATGREFKLDGDIELGFFPWLALRTGQGRFGNAPTFGPEPMVSWKSAQLGAKLIPLLGGRLVANRVSLDGVDLRLVRHTDGTANWQGIGGKKPVDPNAKPMEVQIDGIEIRDSRLSFVDEGSPRRIEITGFSLTTDEIAPGRPFTDTVAAGVLHADGFAAQGVPFKVDVPKAVIAADVSSIAMQKFAVTFGVLEMRGAVEGTLGVKPKLAGTLDTNEFDPRALLTSVGIAPPMTTDANALARFQFAAHWAFDAGAVAVEPLKVLLDDTHLAGTFHRAAGENPVGEFTLHGDDLRIARYIPPTDPSSEPFVLPTAALKAMLFRGVIDLEHATFDDIDMKGVTLRLLLDDRGLRSQSKQSSAAP
jgi:AsmA protein